MHLERFLAMTAVAVSLTACGGGSNSTTTTAPANNPIPTITSISPTSNTAGAAAQTVTINGANFMSTSTVSYNGSAHVATYVSANQLTISASASDQTTAGNYPVVVTNPSPGGGPSNALNFTVNNPLPALSSISPGKLAVGAPSTLITATGSNFVSTSKILFNGAAATTTFVSATELTANAPASVLASGTSVAVTVSSPSPGGGGSSSTSLQLASVASLTMFATPVTPTSPTGPWMAVVAVKDASGNPIAGLPFTIAASQGTLSIDSGVTDTNGSFLTNVTPPAGITSTEVVGLVATIGTQSVSTSIAFTGISANGISSLLAGKRKSNFASVIRSRLGIESVPQASTSSTIAPVAIGISTDAPGSTSPFAAPSYCYSISALSITQSSQCTTLFKQENISLLPTNPFPAACTIARVADKVFGIAECAGAGLTLASCAVSITGVGTVGSLGLTDAVCAGFIDLTTTTLLPDCAGFLLSQFVNHYSPSSTTGLDLVQLSISPIPTDPLDYAVALCDASNPATNPLLGPAVSPVAGNGSQASVVMNGSALGISLNGPTGIAIDSGGNVYFDDDGNNAILELNTSNNVTTFAGTGTAGFSGDGNLATSSRLSNPTQLAFGPNGNLYISDAGNNRIRMVTPGPTSVITTVAGDGYAGFTGDGPDATKVGLNFPDSIAFDSKGDLYIADTSDNRIRMVTPAGVISTVAGNGSAGFNLDGIPATSAELNEPTRIAIDSSDNLYISDLLNNRIREVNGSTHMINYHRRNRDCRH